LRIPCRTRALTGGEFWKPNHPVLETQSPCSPLCGCLVITLSLSFSFFLFLSLFVRIARLELPCTLAYKSPRSCLCPLPLDITFVGIVLSMQDKAFACTSMTIRVTRPCYHAPSGGSKVMVLKLSIPGIAAAVHPSFGKVHSVYICIIVVKFSGTHAQYVHKAKQV